MPNLAVGVEYVYRKYDRGTTGYNLGYQPGAPGYPFSSIYTDRLTYTDPVTNITAPYYVPCQGCYRATGLGHDHDDQPELPGLQRREPDHDQALQQPVADERVAHRSGQPELHAVWTGRGVATSPTRPAWSSPTATAPSPAT